MKWCKKKSSFTLENVIKRVKEINDKHHYDVVKYFKCKKCVKYHIEKL